MSDPRGVALAVDRLGEDVRLLSMEYTKGLLRLSLDIEGNACTLSFDKVLGVRMLDEGDLMEFWAEFSLSNGWIFQLSEGGWLELESQRSGFMASNHLAPREFLVVTRHECVSILCTQNQPDIVWQSDTPQ
ncbi:hypothetical protein [Shewanella sp.]|uniref:hypothetical protein n=1 Tax=Shewanella sp. TaxID=50422 RepID=UPI0035632D12